MKELVKRVPDAGSYAPVTILIDDRPNGVHLSYDKMEFCFPMKTRRPRGLPANLMRKSRACLQRLPGEYRLFEPSLADRISS